MGKALERCFPEDVNLSSELVWKYIDDISKNNLHSYMIEKDGKVIAEGAAAPYSLENSRSVYSLTKSVSVMALGYLVESGKVALEDKVIKYFPEYEERCTNDMIKSCTVRNLLTMNCGLPCQYSDHDFYEAPNWIEEFFTTTPLHAPGSYFEYDNRCAYMLSAIVTRVEGISVYELLYDKVFKSMGIDDIVWEKDSNNISQGGWGMSTSLETITKIGMLLNNGGKWNGKQLISKSWIDKCLFVQIETEGLQDYNKKYGYGYQIWKGKPNGVWLARGAFGQLCIICRQQNMVISLFSGMQSYNEILDPTWDFIDKVLSNPMEQVITGHIWQAKGNKLGINSMQIKAGPKDHISLEVGDKTMNFTAGHNTWVYNELPVDVFSPMTEVFWKKVACRCRWENDNYKMEIAYLETPYTDTVTISTSSNAVAMKYCCYPCIRMRGKEYNIDFTKIE